MAAGHWCSLLVLLAVCSQLIAAKSRVQQATTEDWPPQPCDGHIIVMLDKSNHSLGEDKLFVGLKRRDISSTFVFSANGLVRGLFSRMNILITMSD